MQMIEDKLNESDGREFYRWAVINLPMLIKREKMFINVEKNRLSKNNDEKVVISGNYSRTICISDK